MPNPYIMFSADNIVNTAKRLGVKLALIADHFWIDPILMRVTVLDPVTVMVFDWMRGQEDALYTDPLEVGKEWAEFWFANASYYDSILDGMFNIEIYQGSINLARKYNPDAYDLGFNTRLDLLHLGAITEHIQSEATTERS